MRMRSGSAEPKRMPRNTFSIFLYSVLVHWEISEMPFLKCHKLLPQGIVWNLRSISSSPPSRHCVAHLTTWSLKTPLWSWCRRLRVKQENMSQWGRFSQNRWFGQSPRRVKSFVSPIEASFIASNVLAGSHFLENSRDPSLSLPTTHHRQRFSLQHATRHCSGWLAT